jgi:hypothetical protein
VAKTQFHHRKPEQRVLWLEELMEYANEKGVRFIIQKIE